MPDLVAARGALEARLKELLSEAREIDKELREPPDPDVEDRAIELEDDEVLERLGNSALAEISLIRKALRRIEAGAYGVCVGCRKAISEERLKALPHASMCIKCANS